MRLTLMSAVTVGELKLLALTAVTGLILVGAAVINVLRCVITGTIIRMLVPVRSS